MSKPLNNFKSIANEFFINSTTNLLFFAAILISLIYYICNDNYNQYFFDTKLVLLYLSIVMLSLRVHTKFMGNRWYSPFSLTLIGFSAYYVLGIIIYYLRDSFFYNYEGDISQVNKICFISMSAMIFFYFYSSGIYYLKSTKNSKAQYDTYINIRNTKLVMYSIGIIGLIFAVVFFDFFRDIPLFSEDIDLARTKIMKARGQYFSGVVFLVHAVTLNWLLFICMDRKKILNWFVFLLRLVVFATPLFFYGGRFLMLLPIVVCTILYLNFKKNIPFIKVMLFFIAVFFASMIYVGFRIYGSEANIILLLNAVAADTFPEMRIMAAAISRLKVGHYMSEVFVTPIITFMPSVFWKLFAISKAEFWKPIGEVVLKAFPEGDNIPGIRVSTLGELYIAGGIWASVITMSFMGTALSFVNAQFKNKVGIDKYPYILLSALIPLMMPYGTIFFIMICYVFIEGLFISWAIKARSFDPNNKHLYYCLTDKTI